MIENYSISISFFAFLAFFMRPKNKYTETVFHTQAEIIQPDATILSLRFFAFFARPKNN
jgi:hypothetical protein